MKFFSRFFSGSSEQKTISQSPLTFVECMDVVRNWSAHAAIDPDFDMNDKNLHSALAAHVTCPYCSNDISFGSAVTFHGSHIEVRCPVCKTAPKKEKDYEFDIA